MTRPVVMEQLNTNVVGTTQQGTGVLAIVQAIVTIETAPPPPPPPPEDFEGEREPLTSRGELRVRFVPGTAIERIVDLRINAVPYPLALAIFDGVEWMWSLRPESPPWVNGQTVYIGVKLRDA